MTSDVWFLFFPRSDVVSKFVSLAGGVFEYLFLGCSLILAFFINQMGINRKLYSRPLIILNLFQIILPKS